MYNNNTLRYVLVELQTNQRMDQQTMVDRAITSAQLMEQAAMLLSQNNGVIYGSQYHLSSFVERATMEVMAWWLPGFFGIILQCKSGWIKYG